MYKVRCGCMYKGICRGGINEDKDIGIDVDVDEVIDTFFLKMVFK